MTALPLVPTYTAWWHEWQHHTQQCSGWDLNQWLLNRECDALPLVYRATPRNLPLNHQIYQRLGRWECKHNKQYALILHRALFQRGVDFACCRWTVQFSTFEHKPLHSRNRLPSHNTWLSVRLQNDLYCVGWGVKLCSLTHLTIGNSFVRKKTLIF